jgi:NADH-quinone oxidoreductase subunit F
VGSEYTEEFDSVIVAIGMTQEVDELAGKTGLGIDEYKRIIAEPHTFETSIEGVFAGGDCAIGPDTVVGAVADGRKAALSIDKYLGGNKEEEFKKRKIVRNYFQPVIEEERPRIKIDILEPEERSCSFKEVELCPDRERAVAEASRCFRCDVKFE